MKRYGILIAVAALFYSVNASFGQTSKSDWPMFGGTPSRNMVNFIDKNLPRSWSVAEGKHKNVKWTAKLGRGTFGSPVVAGGRVFVGTAKRHGKNENDHDGGLP